MLGVILGSVVSCAVNSTADIVPTLAAGFVLVGMHWGFASLAFRSDRFGDIVKGSTRVLMKEGQIDWDQMRGRIRAVMTCWVPCAPRGFEILRT